MRAKHLLVLLVSLFCSLWLLSTRVLGAGIWDAAGELASGLFLILALAAFAGAFVLSLFHLVRRWAVDRFLAALSLLVNLLALAMILFGPLDEALDRRDFQAHYAQRMEVVRRVESGELWSGAPLLSLVSLPPEYSRAVSNGAGQRAITVYREGDVLHIVFYPMGGLLRGSALLFRSDGNPPSVPNLRLPYATRSEQLGDHWYLVTVRPSLPILSSPYQYMIEIPRWTGTCRALVTVNWDDPAATERYLQANSARIQNLVGRGGAEPVPVTVTFVAPVPLAEVDRLVGETGLDLDTYTQVGRMATGERTSRGGVARSIPLARAVEADHGAVYQGVLYLKGRILPNTAALRRLSQDPRVYLADTTAVEVAERIGRNPLCWGKPVDLVTLGTPFWGLW
ncbi:MAG: hypothetical protein Q7R39_03460 [Dehalococcoidia bacterium]|nr:hypothetical protein [Dehalococcoidia bacterium]